MFKWKHLYRNAEVFLASVQQKKDRQMLKAWRKKIKKTGSDIYGLNLFFNLCLWDLFSVISSASTIPLKAKLDKASAKMNKCKCRFFSCISTTSHMNWAASKCCNISYMPTFYILKCKFYLLFSVSDVWANVKRMLALENTTKKQWFAVCAQYIIQKSPVLLFSSRLDEISRKLLFFTSCVCVNISSP